MALCVEVLFKRCLVKISHGTTCLNTQYGINKHQTHFTPPQRNLKKEQDGWMGSLLLPLVLFSEKSDGNYLVVGISPVGPDTEIDEAQQVCK